MHVRLLCTLVVQTYVYTCLTLKLYGYSTIVATHPMNPYTYQSSLAVRETWPVP